MQNCRQKRASSGIITQIGAMTDVSSSNKSAETVPKKAEDVNLQKFQDI